MDNKYLMKENGSRVEGDNHLAFSSSVRAERPGNYLFKIESFSLLVQALSKTKRDKYESPQFEARGCKWKLSLYPNGDKKRGGDGYISLYLALADPNSLPQGGEVHVIFKFFVFDYLLDNYLVLLDGKVRRFHALKTEWGFAKLLSLELFTTPSKGYPIDDCCWFGVEMFFFKKESEGIVSSLSIKNNLTRCESTFTWKIDKLSTLPDGVLSDVFSIGGLKWDLLVYPKGFSWAKGNCLSLFLCVDQYSSFPSGWSIYAEYEMSILDQLNQKHHEIKHFMK